MADFSVIVDTVASGATLKDWLDPPIPAGAPSRINPRPGYRFKRWQGVVGREVVLKAVVSGVVAPVDGALGGRLFDSWFVEAPNLPISPPYSVPGFSSIVRFTAWTVGHYTIGIRRPQGGLVHVHVELA